MKPAELSISFDHSAVDATTQAFDRLRMAIEAVNNELEKLGGKEHGGITITAIGSAMTCDVKPPVTISPEEIINCEEAA